VVVLVLVLLLLLLVLLVLLLLLVLPLCLLKASLHAKQFLSQDLLRMIKPKGSLHTATAGHYQRAHALPRARGLCVCVCTCACRCSLPDSDSKGHCCQLALVADDGVALEVPGQFPLDQNLRARCRAPSRGKHDSAR
jgi:hypothetical protein